jgi:hypothetical protein
MEKALVQNRTIEWLDAGLVELSKGEYALATMMLGNSTKYHTCELPSSE